MHRTLIQSKENEKLHRQRLASEEFALVCQQKSIRPIETPVNGYSTDNNQEVS